MASLHGGRSFQIGQPHFFKIIIDKTVRDGRLGIPKRFVRKYGNGLSNPVQLQVPNGDQWSIEFSLSDGEVWLQKGWREFMKHYSLTHGFLLVFEYHRNHLFHVFMFDKSASEIVYPLSINNNVEEDEVEEPKMEDMGDDVSVENLDSPPRKRAKEESPLERSRPNKMSRNNAGKGEEVRAAGSFSVRTSQAFDARSNFTSEYPFFVRALSLYQLGSMRVPCFIMNLMKGRHKTQGTKHRPSCFCVAKNHGL